MLQWDGVKPRDEKPRNKNEHGEEEEHSAEFVAKTNVSCYEFLNHTNLFRVSGGCLMIEIVTIIPG